MRPISSFNTGRKGTWSPDGEWRGAHPARPVVRLPAGRQPLRRRIAARARRGRGYRGASIARSSSSKSSARTPLGLRARHRARVRRAGRRRRVAIVGPSISDNALIAAPLCDAARLPAINYSGGERTRSQWMFHYQVGSLEEEPPLLAARMVERGLRSAAVVFDQSPVGRRYAECFEAARARLGLEVTGTASISSLAENARRSARRASGPEPDVLVYFGLGVSSRAVAVARLELGWDVPVLANSALMFGYAWPDWRDGYAGWEYIDTVADDNRQRVALKRAFAARRGRSDRVRGLRHRASARRGDRAVGSSDPGRHRRRAAAGEAASRDERLRRNPHGLRDDGARGAQRSLPRAA